MKISTTMKVSENCLCGGVSDVSCACLTENDAATDGQCLPDDDNRPSQTITDIPSMFILRLLALQILHVSYLVVSGM